MEFETVERVAVAIFKSAGGYKFGWENITEEQRDAYRLQARESIMAYEDDFHRVQI